MHALEKDAKKYKGAYDKGWDAMREARHKRQIEMGLVKKSWKMTPRARSWEDS